MPSWYVHSRTGWYSAARQRARTRPFTEASASWARQQIRTALDLLAWLDERHFELGHLDQPTVDAWLDQGPSQRYTVRYFLIWARRQRLIGAVQVPLRRTKTPEQSMSDDEHWQQLKRCLHNTTVPLRVRAAGALLLLYGQPVSRIVLTRVAQLDERADGTYLTIDRHPVLLPPALAILVRELGRTATPKAILGRRGAPISWLFPGHLPGQHLSVNFLVRELNGQGIRARMSRNAALLDLAGDLPAAILADLLGMHINTAVRWVKKAKRDWTGYLAARTAGDQRQ